MFNVLQGRRKKLESGTDTDTDSEKSSVADSDAGGTDSEAQWLESD